MKRNAFGDPQPSNFAEMVEALDERNADAGDVWASVDIGDDGGWYATVQHNDDGEAIFETVEYPGDKSALLADLRAAGIEVI